VYMSVFYLSVCPLTRTSRAIVSNFQCSSRVPGGKFKAQKIWGSWVGGHKIYTVCFPLHRRRPTGQLCALAAGLPHCWRSDTLWCHVTKFTV